MKKESYIKMVNNVKANKRLERTLIFANSILTGVVYASFPFLLFALFYNKQYDQLIRIVLVCGISFVLVSVFRYFFNAKRPYAMYGYEPVVAFFSSYIDCCPQSVSGRSLYKRRSGRSAYWNYFRNNRIFHNIRETSFG